MKAIQFNAAIPRYALGLALGKIYQPILWSGLSCVQYLDVPEPRLPNDEWVKIKTRLGGVCGSDNHLLHLHNSPSASAVTSFPFTIGHENVGTISEIGTRVAGFKVGDRVVIEPTLWCKPRGFAEPCEFCARGDIQLCERVTEGSISAGLLTGSCRDTGGSWSSYYLAHESQIYRVPDAVSDENALLVEPFATSMHAVLADPPRDDQTVLVFGAGVIGLGIIAAIRALDIKSRIIVIARHGIQKELAKKFGADEIIASSRDGSHFAAFAQAVKGKLFKPILGKPVLVGGADFVYECVGNADSIDDSLRFARAHGVVVLAGLAAVPNGVDWTPIWMKELDLKGTYTYGYDTWQDKRWRTFDLVLDLMARGKADLSPMITHKFPLNEYARAFDVVNKRSREKSVKVVFEFK